MIMKIKLNVTAIEFVSEILSLCVLERKAVTQGAPGTAMGARNQPSLMLILWGIGF
jgi:hypothetical protein